MGVAIASVAGLVAVLVMAWPLIAGRAPDGEPGERADARRAVSEDLERSLAAIREIEMDHRAGHLSDADFAELDAGERARAVALMRRRDELDA